jgi:hypothetical protein
VAGQLRQCYARCVASPLDIVALIDKRLGVRGAYRRLRDRHHGYPPRGDGWRADDVRARLSVDPFVRDWTCPSAPRLCAVLAGIRRDLYDGTIIATGRRAPGGKREALSPLDCFDLALWDAPNGGLRLFDRSVPLLTILSGRASEAVCDALFEDMAPADVSADEVKTAPADEAAKVADTVQPSPPAAATEPPIVSTDQAPPAATTEPPVGSPASPLAGEPALNPTFVTDRLVRYLLDTPPGEETKTNRLTRKFKCDRKTVARARRKAQRSAKTSADDV